MIPPPNLEIAVLVLGLVVLMFEAFATKIDKRVLAYAALAGLTTILIGTFFLQHVSAPEGATGFWNFYTADALAIFFKRFALVTTIVVLVMMIDYAPVVRNFTSNDPSRAAVGEFFALPI